MNAWCRILFVFWLAGSGVVRAAEEIILFDATASDHSVWVTETARVTKKGKDLLVSEDHPADTYGSVYTQERFVFIPDGDLEIDVKQVVAGTYSIQVLALKGNQIIHTADLAKNSVQTGRNGFPLKYIGLPAETETIVFKVWVADAESASTRFRKLQYVVPIREDRILFDNRFNRPGDWKPFDTAWLGVPDGAQVAVNREFTFGAIESTTRVEWPAAGYLFLDVSGIESGDTSVQLVAFDSENNYLESVDLIKNVFGGWHAADLRSVPRPAGADRFLIKIWVGGSEQAKAVYRRVLILGTE